MSWIKELKGLGEAIVSIRAYLNRKLDEAIAEFRKDAQGKLADLQREIQQAIASPPGEPDEHTRMMLEQSAPKVNGRRRLVVK